MGKKRRTIVRKPALPAHIEHAFGQLEELPPHDEEAFQAWYADVAQRTGLNPDPDDPKHFYDYRSAFRTGAEPGPDGHWPSEFKMPGHPNLIVEGKDTRTGEFVDPWPKRHAKAALEYGKSWRPDLLAGNLDAIGRSALDAAAGLGKRAAHVAAGATTTAANAALNRLEYEHYKRTHAPGPMGHPTMEQWIRMKGMPEFQADPNAPRDVPDQPQQTPTGPDAYRPGLEGPWWLKGESAVPEQTGPLWQGDREELPAATRGEVGTTLPPVEGFGANIVQGWKGSSWGGAWQAGKAAGQASDIDQTDDEWARAWVRGDYGQAGPPIGRGGATGRFIGHFLGDWTVTAPYTMMRLPMAAADIELQQGGTNESAVAAGLFEAAFLLAMARVAGGRGAIAGEALTRKMSGPALRRHFRKRVTPEHRARLEQAIANGDKKAVDILLADVLRLSLVGVVEAEAIGLTIRAAQEYTTALLSGRDVGEEMTQFAHDFPQVAMDVLKTGAFIAMFGGVHGAMRVPRRVDAQWQQLQVRMANAQQVKNPRQREQAMDEVFEDFASWLGGLKQKHAEAAAKARQPDRQLPTGERGWVFGKKDKPPKKPAEKPEEPESPGWTIKNLKPGDKLKTKKGEDIMVLRHKGSKIRLRMPSGRIVETDRYKLEDRVNEGLVTLPPRGASAGQPPAPAEAAPAEPAPAEPPMDSAEARSIIIGEKPGNLRSAFRLPNGRVVVGEPGESHNDLRQREGEISLDELKAIGEQQADATGFVDPSSGRFFSIRDLDSPAEPPAPAVDPLEGLTEKQRKLVQELHDLGVYGQQDVEETAAAAGMSPEAVTAAAEELDRLWREDFLRRKSADEPSEAGGQAPSAPETAPAAPTGPDAEKIKFLKEQIAIHEAELRESDWVRDNPKLAQESRETLALRRKQLAELEQPADPEEIMKRLREIDEELKGLLIRFTDPNDIEAHRQVEALEKEHNELREKLGGIEPSEKPELSDKEESLVEEPPKGATEVMGHKVALSEEVEYGGVTYELYAETEDGGGSVRVVDESGEVVSIQRWKKFAEAKAKYDEAVDKAASDALTKAAPTAEAETGVEQPKSVRLANSIGLVLGSESEGSPVGHISKDELISLANIAYGGTQAEGAWQMKEAYDALELAINRFILEKGEEYDVGATASLERAKAIAKSLATMVEALPTQTKRTMEQEERQQFSTPPDYAAGVNWIANIRPGEIYLEPSAGLGGLAVFGKLANARVHTNEMADRRAEMLENLGLGPSHRVNAEHIQGLLRDAPRPSVIVMNPPFSASAHMGKKLGTGAKHVEKALQHLMPGGRLVAIVGRGMGMTAPSFKDWWAKIAKDYNVLANVEVVGKVYKKYGTSFATRVLVIDKPLEGQERGLSPENAQLLADLEAQAAEQGRVVDARLQEKIDALKKGVPQPPFQGYADSVPKLLELLENIRNARSEPPEQPLAESGGTPPAGPGEGGAGPERPISPATGGMGAPAEGTGPPGPVSGRPRDGGAEVTERQPEEGTAPIEPVDRPAAPEAAAPGSEARPGESAPVAPGEPGGVRPANVELEAEYGETESIGTFQHYKTAINIPGAQPHVTPLAETAAMASISVPDVTDVKILIPKEAIESGQVSNAQLEGVALAERAHETIFPNGERQGIYFGEGTGMGKAREGLAVMWQNWMKGKKRHVMISKNDDLFADAKDQLKEMGWDPDLLFKLTDTKGAHLELPDRDGILYGTYSLLWRASSTGGGAEKTRIEQIRDWLGEDFDGVVFMDEAHLMKGAKATADSFGSPAGSKSGIAGIDFQSMIPKGRLVYGSATPATEVKDLAYAPRLGLWGPGTEFADVDDFIESIGSRGLSAMEIVTRELKGRGLYLSRTLSYVDPEGRPDMSVEHDTLIHEITADQRAMYNELAAIWRQVYEWVWQSAEDSGMPTNRIEGIFRGAELRFFSAVIMGMKMPTVIKRMREGLAEGMSPLIQLVNTNDAVQGRKIGAMQEGDQVDELDFSPKEALIEYVERHFPIHMWEERPNPTNPDGPPDRRPIMEPDPDNPGKDRHAIDPVLVARKEQLLTKILAIRAPENPLDQLLNAFGPDEYAEVTGRKQRRVSGKWTKSGQDELQTMGKLFQRKEKRRFLYGDAKALAISGVAGTGASFHTDRRFKNQRRRLHITVQAGFVAITVEQMNGRSHRANQVNAPFYLTAINNNPIEKRFSGAIAAKMSAMGALGKGERTAGGAAQFRPEDNIMSREATLGLRQFFRDVWNNQIPGINRQTFEDDLHLTLANDSGNLKSPGQMPEMRQITNRLLSLPLEVSEKYYGLIEDRIKTAIQVAKDNGTLDVGTEVLIGKSVKKMGEQIVAVEEGTGLKTRLVTVQVTKDINTKTFDAVDIEGISFYKQKRSGNILAAGMRVSTTQEDGRVISGRMTFGPQGYRHFMTDFDLRNNFTEVTDRAEAKQLWDARVAESPKTEDITHYLLEGNLLAHWSKLPGRVQVKRAITDSGEGILGIELRPAERDDLLRDLGIEVELPNWAKKIDQGLVDMVMNGWKLTLSNAWEIMPRRVEGEPRMEIRGPDYSHHERLEAAGVLIEKIASKVRYFIPLGNPIPVLNAVTQRENIVEVSEYRRGGGSMTMGMGLGALQDPKVLEALSSAVRQAVKGGKWSAQATAAAAEWVYRSTAGKPGNYASVRDSLLKRFGQAIKRWVNQIWQAVQRFSESARHRSFWPAKTRVLQEHAVKPPITRHEATKKVERWRAEAERIGREENHSNEVVISLYDRTGNWAQPYRDAGYDVRLYDYAHGHDLARIDVAAEIAKIRAEGKEIVGVLSAPPCTSFANCAAKWSDLHRKNRAEVTKRHGEWAGKNFKSLYDYYVHLTKQAMAFSEQANPHFYALENPPGRISDDTGLPAPIYSFQPHHFGDPYTKKTMVYGDFNTNLPSANVHPSEKDYIWNMPPSPTRAADRSVTPEGFSYAFFMANHRFTGPGVRPRHADVGAVDIGMLVAPIKAALKAGKWTVDATAKAAQWLLGSSGAKAKPAEARKSLVGAFGGGISKFFGRIWKAFRTLVHKELHPRPKEVYEAGKPAAPQTITAMTKALKGAEDIQMDYEAQLGKIRKQQAARIKAAEEDYWAGPEDLNKIGEFLGLSRGAMKGELPKQAVEPLKEFLSEEQMQELYDHAMSHRILEKEAPHTKVNVIEAMQALFDGGIVPYPYIVRYLRRIFGPDFGRELNKRQTETWERWLHHFLNTLGAAKTFKSSWDLSAIGRQGAAGWYIRPIEAGVRPAVRSTLTALWFVGEPYGRHLYHKMTDDPMHAQAVKDGLYIVPYDVNVPLTEREEMMMGRLFENIPILKHLHWILGMRWSERSFLTMMNLQRRALYDFRAKQINAMPMTETEKKKARRSWALQVNALTGRANVDFGNMGIFLNAVGYAPRYAISQFEAPVRMVGAGAVRKGMRWALVFNMVRMGINFALLTVLLKLANDFFTDKKDPNWEPMEFDLHVTSPTFGRIRQGDVSVDMVGGKGAAWRRVFQSLIFDESWDPQKEDYVTSPQFGQTFGFYAKNKLAPYPSYWVHYNEGENYDGQPMVKWGDDPKEALKQFGWEVYAPISWDTLDDFMKYNEHYAYLYATFEALGLSTQIYEEKQPAKPKVPTVTAPPRRKARPKRESRKR